MNTVLKKMGQLIRDLLGISEQLIRIGRNDYYIDNDNTSYIGIDAISPARRLAGGTGYNGTTEIETIEEQWRASIIISFYGDNAYTNAESFQLLLSNQKSSDLQYDLGISVFKTTQYLDVKRLAGKDYQNRIDLTLNVNYTISATVDTLRIDTAELEEILINE